MQRSTRRAVLPRLAAVGALVATALIVARPTLFTETLFKPAIWALNGTGNFLLRLLGMRAASGHEMVHSVEELKMLVEASEESGPAVHGRPPGWRDSTPGGRVSPGGASWTRIVPRSN